MKKITKVVSNAKEKYKTEKKGDTAPHAAKMRSVIDTTTDTPTNTATNTIEFPSQFSEFSQKDRKKSEINETEMNNSNLEETLNINSLPSSDNNNMHRSSTNTNSELADIIPKNTFQSQSSNTTIVDAPNFNNNNNNNKKSQSYRYQRQATFDEHESSSIPANVDVTVNPSDIDINNNNNNNNNNNTNDSNNGTFENTIDYDYNVFESTSYCGMIHHISCLYPTPHYQLCNLNNLYKAIKNLFLYYLVGIAGAIIIYLLPLTQDGIISLGFFVILWWINIIHATKLQFWGGKNIVVCEYSCNITMAYDMYEIIINRRDGFIYLKIVKPFEKVLNKKICAIPGFRNIDVIKRENDYHKVTRIEYLKQETNQRNPNAKHEDLEITSEKFVEKTLDKVNFVMSTGQFQRYHCPTC